MQYCNECVYPETKPDLAFNDKGVCSACDAYKKREAVDWQRRAQEFVELAERTRSLMRDFDCVVPVSGGKDSHYQVIKCKEHGLKVLAVCAETDDISDIGRANLNNISKLCDLVTVSVDKTVRARIAAYGLRQVGDISWAEHITIFTIPVRVASQFRVPLIVWGENPQNEYGGPYRAQTATKLDNRWLQEYGGLNGLRLSDLIDKGVAQAHELSLYRYPALSTGDMSGIFLGQYFPWDGYENALVAAKHGFKWNPRPVEGVGYAYENLDNYQTGIHDRFKYLKFGFGRATDLACNHIRRGRLTRGEAKEHILEWDGTYNGTYLGRSFEQILEPLGISITEYLLLEEKYVNKDLFTWLHDWYLLRP